MKDALIACQTSSINAAPIVGAILQLEFDLRWNAWFSRVPTELSIADAPSRGEIQQLLDEGISQYEVDLNNMWTDLLELSTRGGDDQQPMSHGNRLACARDFGSLVHGMAGLACARDAPSFMIIIL